jgi:UDP-N-acetylmuramoyl-L-alanyl-D-glutamate--2,6-diaminopimelate ligase
MGEAVMLYSDRAVVTSDNPRTEDPMSIISEITSAPSLHAVLCEPPAFRRAASAKGSLATVLPDRREAIQLALETASDGDLILIAGKGHEDYQEVRGVRQPFSDRDVTTHIIEKLGWKVVSA